MALRWIGAALVLLTGVALYLRAGNMRQRDDALAAPAPTFALPVLLPANRVAFSPTRLSPRAIALAAVTEAAQTTFIALDADGHAEALTSPLVVDGRAATLRAGVLAYLVLPGLDPTQNYVEVKELARGGGWQVQAEEGYAIFGFALDPQGTHLIYLEADARTVGARAPWWVVAVNLATGAKRMLLDSSKTDVVALLPLDWSPEAILFRGLAPFTNQYDGLWVTNADGSGLHPIMAEADYVGQPRLSPEGDRLALLVSDQSALPVARRNAGAGEPPANAIYFLNVRQGELTLVSPPWPQHDLASPAWTADGLIAIAGEWDADHNAFLPRSVVLWPSSPPPPSSGSVPPSVLYATAKGDITHLAACPDEGWLAAIWVEDKTQIIRAGQAEPVVEFDGPALDWLACLSPKATR